MRQKGSGSREEYILGKAFCFFDVLFLELGDKQENTLCCWESFMFLFNYFRFSISLVSLLHLLSDVLHVETKYQIIDGMVHECNKF